jgi:predicted AlkP superfamily pyrophosphatase or phosphodiesterase
MRKLLLEFETWSLRECTELEATLGGPMRRLCAPLLILLSACRTPPHASPGGSDRIVVLISIDGFPAYALEDSKLPVPTLRRMMQEGASARGMTIVNPTVTWPNHTTLATGVAPAKHGVLYNGLLVREPGMPPRIEPRSRADLVRVPTIYDVAHQAGLSTAQVDWVPWQTGSSLDWAFEENPDPRGQVAREMISGGLASELDLTEFKKGNPAWRDEVWTRAATHIIRAHRPNLLLFHLLNLDAIHHRYGPRTPASLTAIALADARVSEVLAALEHSGLQDQATVIVVSDHGFRGSRKSIRPNAALLRAGFIRAEGAKIASSDAYAVPEGGTAMVYLRQEGALAPAQGILEVLRSLDGVAAILLPEEFPALGLPLRKDNPQSPEFILVAKPGYAFDRSWEGEPVVDIAEGMPAGHHGFIARDADMNAVFIAWGRGIRRGVRLDTIRNIDVAPTLAGLLGLRMDPVDGAPLSEILQ